MSTVGSIAGHSVKGGRLWRTIPRKKARALRVDIVQGKGSVNSKTATDGGHTHKYNGNTENGGEPDHNHGYKGTTEETKHSHSLASFNIYKATMTVYNALKVGEKVHLLSFDNGKKYYVLDRVV